MFVENVDGILIRFFMHKSSELDTKGLKIHEVRHYKQYQSPSYILSY